MRKIEDDKLSDDEKIQLIEEGFEKQSVATLYAIARLYENQGEWKKALDAIQKAIQEDPMNSSFHSKKAAYVYALGNKSIAYREALTAYQLGSKSLQQSLDLARMGVALSEYSIVNNIIDSLLIAYPDDEEVLYMTARKYHHNNDLKSAKEYYRRVNTLNPDNQLNNYYYAQLLVTLFDFEEAKSILSTVSGESTEAHRQAHELLAEIYYGSGQYDSAATVYKTILTWQKDTVVYNRIVECYKQLNNTDSIISIAKTAIGDYPANKSYYFLVAKELDTRYRYEEALGYYQNVYELDTLDTLVAEEIAILQRKIAYLHRIRVEQRKLADSLKMADSVQLNN
ncbi:MAG: tetratricopeptide repeat protein [Bacteroidota bacterium]